MIFPNNGALFHGQGDEFRNFIERLEQEDCSSLEEALCTWASLRMQTLWRTVDGICGAYANALDLEFLGGPWWERSRERPLELGIPWPHLGGEMEHGMII